MQPHTHTHKYTLLLSVTFGVCVVEGINTPAAQEKQNHVKHTELFLTALTVETEVMFMAASDQGR